MAQAGGVGVLPISRRAGKSPATGAFLLAVDSLVAVCSTPPQSALAGDLERDRPNPGSLDPCAAHPASVSECSFRRPYPREEPYAVAPLVRMCGGHPAMGVPTVTQIRVAGLDFESHQPPQPPTAYTESNASAAGPSCSSFVALWATTS